MVLEQVQWSGGTMLTGRHLIEPGDFTLEELEELFRLAEDIEANRDRVRDYCRGKVLATLFF
jgi:aspartate carbamoyltransferase catalytic subunit